MPARSRRARARADKTQADTTLAKLRLAAGATQSEVARACGLSLSTYRRLESGAHKKDPPIRPLVNAALALGADPLLLLQEYLTWHVFDDRHPEPPGPGEVASGVPPEHPAAPAADSEFTTAAESFASAFRELAIADEAADGLVLRIERTDSEYVHFLAETRTGEPYRRRRRLALRRSDLEGLLQAGLLAPRAYEITPAGRTFAATRMRRS